MMKNEDTFTSQVYQILHQENPMKFKILGPGRDSVFSVSWSPPGGPLWPLNSGPFACLYGTPSIDHKPPASEKVSLENTKSRIGMESYY